MHTFLITHIPIENLSLTSLWLLPDEFLCFCLYRPPPPSWLPPPLPSCPESWGVNQSVASLPGESLAPPPIPPGSVRFHPHMSIKSIHSIDWLSSAALLWDCVCLCVRQDHLKHHKKDLSCCTRGINVCFFNIIRQCKNYRSWQCRAAIYQRPWDGVKPVLSLLFVPGLPLAQTYRHIFKKKPQLATFEVNVMNVARAHLRKLIII